MGDMGWAADTRETWGIIGTIVQLAVFFIVFPFLFLAGIFYLVCAGFNIIYSILEGTAAVIELGKAFLATFQAKRKRLRKERGLE